MSKQSIILEGQEIYTILNQKRIKIWREINPQPTDQTTQVLHLTDGIRFATEEKFRKFPYGQPGNQLWIKESYSTGYAHILGGAPLVKYTSDNLILVGNVMNPINNKSDSYRSICRETRPQPASQMEEWASRADVLVETTWAQRIGKDQNLINPWIWIIELILVQND